MVSECRFKVTLIENGYTTYNWQKCVPVYRFLHTVMYLAWRIRQKYYLLILKNTFYY